MTIALSDDQQVDPASISKVELFDEDRLLITLKDQSHIKVQGAGALRDADLLDDIRDRERLSFAVFRKK